MNCCGETVKMAVTPGNRPAYRGIGSEAYLNGTSQGSTPEDARKDSHIRGRSRQFVKLPGWQCTRLFGFSTDIPRFQPETKDFRLELSGFSPALAGLALCVFR
jgi:hypothetical protein